MTERKHTRNYLTREYEEVTAAENARVLGRKGNDFAILDLAQRKLMEGVRLALFQGCAEAYGKGRYTAVDSFCLGTRMYILNAEDNPSFAERTPEERDAALAKAPTLFTAKTSRPLCDALHAFSEAHPECAPMVSDTASMIAASGGLTKPATKKGNDLRLGK